ncbi:hypothetical protein HaLaN_15049 [Haematococcus lacustris]|uniref:Uncharacterized protein n=1 Tax=Haematococcus lacustris TaxID=44745 RepID=A0A699Z9J0_HAELA|nr:hypothetical protein HaLaN_15049 [Haematococcus lacustris]
MPDGKRWESLDVLLAFARGRDVAARAAKSRVNDRPDRFQPADLRRRDEGRGHNKGKSPSRDPRHVSFVDDGDRAKRHK